MCLASGLAGAKFGLLNTMLRKVINNLPFCERGGAAFCERGGSGT